MGTEVSSKVQARHLSRNAYLYVRQSTLRQVFENTESTKRQYALRQRAIALGWQVEQVVVILTPTRAARAPLRSIERASSGWLRRWVLGGPAS